MAIVPPVGGPALGGTFGGRVVINPAKLARFLRSEDGPLIRELLNIGDQVRDEAKKEVGVYKNRGPIPRQRKPGTLRDSIVKRVVTEKGWPVVLVGSEDDVAKIHHEGTDPHVIQGRPLLVFANAGGEVIFARRVQHPGTAPNRYLVNAAQTVARRY